MHIFRSARPCFTAFVFLRPVLLPGGGLESQGGDTVCASALQTTAQQQNWLQKTKSCKTPSSAPEDEHKVAQNMLS
jgi:hypothetical protein